MIISASRRTDIPALYSEWFMNRLREGEMLVPNPYNRRKLQRIALSPDTIDMIVFWTKNPEPMIPYLQEMDQMGYHYSFQVTITDYGTDVEPEVPCTEDVMASFILMSEMLGKERIDWRFDPILLDGKYTVDYHLRHFETMCRWLQDATTRCTISFVDAYRESPYGELELEDMKELAEGIGKISEKYHLPVFTCAEHADFRQFGILPGACIDRARIQKLLGYRLDVKKASGQRKDCNCVESLDIGVYDTCIHGCRYCYATGTGSAENAVKKYEQHDPKSPLLIGHLKGDEIITEKKITSNRDDQLSLFDLPRMDLIY